MARVLAACGGLRGKRQKKIFIDPLTTVLSTTPKGPALSYRSWAYATGAAGCPRRRLYRSLFLRPLPRKLLMRNQTVTRDLWLSIAFEWFRNLVGGSSWIQTQFRTGLLLLRSRESL